MDIEASWKAALKEFSEDFQPIAERFGERNVRFTPENCWLVVDSPDMVDVSVRQMLEKDHQRRKANGQIRLKDAHFQEIKNDIDMVNMYMDLWENGKLNPITGEVEMKGRFDVYPKLRLIIDKYFDCLNGD